MTGELGNTQKFHRFNIDCCRFIWDVLPPVAKQALMIAEGFAAGEISIQRLRQERVALWTFLGNRSCDFTDPQVSAVRAVICCLYETTNENELFESACFLVDCCVEAFMNPIPFDDLLARAYGPTETM